MHPCTPASPDMGKEADHAYAQDLARDREWLVVQQRQPNMRRRATICEQTTLGATLQAATIRDPKFLQVVYRWDWAPPSVCGAAPSNVKSVIVISLIVSTPASVDTVN